MRLTFAIFATVLLALSFSPVNAQNPPSARPAPTVVPALDGIFSAFKSHPIVGMLNHEGGNNHDLAQQEDFYAAIVRDPRFAQRVGNLVVEIGASSAQDIINRYVNGGDVPYEQLRKVWTDTLGWMPPPIDVGYVNLFAQVRATNLALPVSQRIHVWLGEPPVDWSKIQNRQQLSPSGIDALQYRDNFAAELINRQILAKDHRALVIYGGYHFLADQLLIGASRPVGTTTMAQQVEKRNPGAIFRVSTYIGNFGSPACIAKFERDKGKFKLPVLLAPVHGTALDDPMFIQRCPPTGIGPPPNLSPARKSEFLTHAARDVYGLNADAMLYLGPASSLTGSPMMPDAYLDTTYMNEIMRRMKIVEPKVTPSILGITVDENPASPRPFTQ